MVQDMEAVTGGNNVNLFTKKCVILHCQQRLVSTNLAKLVTTSKEQRLKIPVTRTKVVIRNLKIKLNKNQQCDEKQQRAYLGQLVREELMSMMTQTQSQGNMMNPMFQNINMDQNMYQRQNQNPVKILFSNLLKN